MEALCEALPLANCVPRRYNIAMFRQHFEALADALASLCVQLDLNHQETLAAMRTIGEVCEQFNGRFDPSQFERHVSRHIDEINTHLENAQKANKEFTNA